MTLSSTPEKLPAHWPCVRVHPQIADRTEAAHKGIPLTLAAIKKAAE
jgi:hypothetical protein